MPRNKVTQLSYKIEVKSDTTGEWMKFRSGSRTRPQLTFATNDSAQEWLALAGLNNPNYRIVSEWDHHCPDCDGDGTII